jgi:hypothetical protein
MSLAKRLFFVVLVACGLASGASAQTVTFESDMGMHYIDDAVGCVAKNEIDAPVAREYLVTRFDPRDREIYRRKLSSRLGCDRGEGAARIAIDFGGDVFRYALANVLVKEDYLGKPPTDFANAPPIRHFQPASIEQMTSGLKGSKLKAVQRDHASAMLIFMYSMMGECLARKQPEAVIHLLRQPVDSKDEKRALEALAPAVVDCGKLQKDMKFSQSWMRGAIALSYYRLAFSIDPRPLPKDRKTDA